MFVWGIFHSREDQESTIHFDDFTGRLFTTEELAVECLKLQEKWWREVYADPFLMNQYKNEFFDFKTPDESIRWTKEPNEYDNDELQTVLSRDYSESNGIKMCERYVVRQLDVKDEGGYTTCL